jgi:hypothetical protein
VTGPWRPSPTAPLSARGYPELLWTGHELMVLEGQEIRDSRPADDFGCFVDDTVRFTDGAAYDPLTDRWRPLVGQVAFHHGATWTGSWLTDGWSWCDPATGERGAAPANPFLVYAPAVWTGTEVLNVGSDGSGQPCGHTVWAWDPTTDRTRTSAVPGPPCGESVEVRWTGTELLVTTWMTYRGTHAWNPGTDEWRTIPEAAGPVAGGGWDGHRLTAVTADVAPSLERPFVRHPLRLRLTDPADGSWTSHSLPEGLEDPETFTEAVTGSGRTAVANGPCVALFDVDRGWSDVLEVPSGASFTWAWAGEHLFAWSTAGANSAWVLSADNLTAPV